MKSHKTYFLISIMLGVLHLASHTYAAAEKQQEENNMTLFEAIEAPKANQLVVSFTLRLANIHSTLKGDSVLHRAKDPTIAQLLLDHGAPLEKKNTEGYTPLVKAVDDYLMDTTNSTAMIEVLLQNGANIMAPYFNESLCEVLEDTIECYRENKELNLADRAKTALQLIKETQQKIDDNAKIVLSPSLTPRVIA